MKKLLLLILLITVVLSSNSYACSPARNLIKVSCTQIDSLENGNHKDYINLEPNRRYLDEMPNVDIHKKILISNDKNCQENLTFIAENYDLFIGDWEEDWSVWSSTIVITNKELDPKKDWDKKYLEFEDKPLNCMTFRTNNIGEYTSFFYDAKDYCFNGPQSCGVRYYVNPIKFFFHNLTNPSWMGLLYNIIILGVLGGLGLGFYKKRLLIVLKSLLKSK